MEYAIHKHVFFYTFIYNKTTKESYPVYIRK